MVVKPHFLYTCAIVFARYKIIKVNELGKQLNNKIIKIIGKSRYLKFPGYAFSLWNVTCPLLSIGRPSPVSLSMAMLSMRASNFAGVDGGSLRNVCLEKLFFVGMNGGADDTFNTVR